MAINWDLTSSHTTSDVNFDRDADVEDYSIEPVASVRITLPGDGVFEAEDVQDIRIGRKGDLIELIEVVLDRRTAEAAHERAAGLAKRWELSRHGLDEWLDKIRSALAANEDEAGVGQALATGDVLAPAPFYPSVDILYSFDNAKPWLVSFTMYWDPELTRPEQLDK